MSETAVPVFESSPVNSSQKNSSERKELLNKPEILDLGKAVAFVIKPFDQLSKDQLIAHINEARLAGIPIHSAGEGQFLIGYLGNPDHAKLVKKFGEAFFGLTGEETASFLHNDAERSTIVQGSNSTIATVRVMQNQNRVSNAAVLVQSPTPNSVTGYKDSHLEYMDESQIQYPPKFDLPQEVVSPLELENIKTDYFDQLKAVKVDVNAFSSTFTKATKNGQIALDQKFIMFYNFIGDSLKEQGIFLGEQTTDSLNFYYQYEEQKAAIESILAQAIQEYKFSIKAVETDLADVELTSYKGRVIHSNKPVSEFLWADLEKEAKQQTLEALGDFNTPREEIESKIYSRQPFESNVAERELVSV